MKYYVPLQIARWHCLSVSTNGLTVTREGDLRPHEVRIEAGPSEGFLVAYATLADLRREFPTQDYITIETVE